MNMNFMLKVEDAKLADIQKALKEAGIKVRSIQEIYRDKQAGEQTETAKTNA